MKQKWTGKITEDLRSMGAAIAGDEPEFKKGDPVICRKKRIYDEKNSWTGKYEYFYQSPNRRVMVRSTKFLVE